MEDRARGPSPNDFDYFKGRLEKIIESNQQRDPMWWNVGIEHLGFELKKAFGQGEVTEEQVETIKKGVADFMNQGTNRQDYERALDETDFWWEKGVLEEG
jgi:hypothetical protein